MDGTIADLYSVNLETENVRPYVEAKPLVDVAIVTSLVKEIVKKAAQIIINVFAKRKSMVI